jgi:sugar phosphate isomerase/epimerase
VDEAEIARSFYSINVQPNVSVYLMKTIKGPAIFLAQFMGDKPPFDNLKTICKWAASLGYVGVQIPAWDKRCIDLQKAAESKDYCDEFKGTVESCGLQVTELSTHLQGQLVAVHPAYNEMFDAFAPKAYHGNPKERTAWAVDQMKFAAKASKNLGLKAHATFSGRCYGIQSIPGLNGRQDWSKTGSRSLQKDGCRY